MTFEGRVWLILFILLVSAQNIATAQWLGVLDYTPTEETSDGVYFTNGRLIFRDGRDLLPPPPDPNDFFNNSMPTIETRMGLGHGVALFSPFSDAPSQPEFRYGARATYSVFYDKGAFDDGGTLFSFPNIALRGTTHRDGQIFANSNGAMRQQFDLQQNFLQMGMGQAYTEFFVTQDEFGKSRVVVPYVYGRVFDADGVREGNPRVSLEVGELQTLFGDDGSVPTTLTTDVRPVGAISRVETNPTQLRTSVVWPGGISLGIGLELPDYGGVSVATGEAITLDRLPTLTSRLRYQSEGFTSAQVAGIVRPLVVEEMMSFNEHHTTAWGISAQGRIQTIPDISRLFFGITGGSGIGDLFLPGMQAATFEVATSWKRFANLGGFVGVEQVLLTNAAQEPLLVSTAAYSYAFTDTVASMPDANRKYHQAWANLFWRQNDNVAFGTEFQYGSREVEDGRQGENSRLMFIFGISSNGKAEKVRAGTGAQHRL